MGYMKVFGIGIGCLLLINAFGFMIFGISATKVGLRMPLQSVFTFKDKDGKIFRVNLK